MLIYIADIKQDIDDIIAIEFIKSIGIDFAVVLDRDGQENEPEVLTLKKKGIIFKSEIPTGTEVIFVGGGLTKVAKYLEKNKVNIIVMNGGFAGDNLVKRKNRLTKFNGKETVRTFNFSIDHKATRKVLFQYNGKYNRLLLVSKNVCHSKKNVKGVLHNDEFLYSFDLRKGKRLHDLLMVKEGINLIHKNLMVCKYKAIIPYYEIRNGNVYWGSKLCNDSNIQISVCFSNIFQAGKVE